MKKILYAILGLVIANTAVAQPKTLYFDPNYATGAPVSKIFEEVTYIPLETTKESLFGYIGHLVVTEDYFIVLDFDTNTIYFFNKNGKFVKKYENKKYSLKSIQYMADKNALYIAGMNKNFNPTSKELQAIMENPMDRKLNKFAQVWHFPLKDIQNAKTEEIKNFDIVLTNPVPFNNNSWVFSNIYANKNAADSIDYEIKISNGKNVEKMFLPYNRYKAGLFTSRPGSAIFSQTGYEDTLLFARPYDYHVYQLTPDSIRVLYKIILPYENSLPQSFYSLTFNTRGEYDDYRQKYAAYVWGLQGLITYKNLLFFNLDFFRSPRDRRFVFDNTTSQFYNLSKITGDSTNAFLPVMGNNFQYNDNNYLYTSVASSHMFNNKENTAKRNPVYNDVMKNYFDKSNSSSNPVIIQLKPKASIKP